MQRETGEIDSTAGYESSPRYADVIVPRGPGRAFTYLIPPTFRATLAVGQRVVVPFRAATVPAVVTALHHQLPSGIERRHVKEIHSLMNGGPGSDSGLSPAQLQLSHWLSERFLAPWGQCVKLVSPVIQSGMKSSTKWFITPEGRQVLNSSRKLLPNQRRMLERLAHRPSGLAWETVKRSIGDSALRARAALVRRGLMEQRAKVDSAAPSTASTGSRSVEHRLSSVEPLLDRDEKAGEFPVSIRGDILRLWDSEQGGTVLLQAGHEDRMKVLFQIVKETLHRKRPVLILTGEVGRAQEIAETLSYAGIDEVHLFHGNLPVREKARVWQAMRFNPVNVVVGTRSAACSPVQNLGLVWVEGEEDAALKEEQSPRYHAREIARMRAQLDRAVLVLASAHPSLESLHAAIAGRAVSWSVPVKREQVSVETVDLRRFPAGTVVSPPVIDGIRTALGERKMVVLFLNRKGYASLLLCRACGEAPSCPACSLALRFHKRGGILLCHSCGHRRDVPDMCPACQAVSLEPVGFGTERVEELLRRHFPHIRIGRMDGEVIRRSAQAEALLSLARAGDIDVIIGTQMLFLHREIPRAGLVAVLNADAGLHMPDFRSAERAYHALQDALLLSDTKGQGRVLIQTYLPHHHALEAVVHDNPSLFVDTELAFREGLQYPPFTHLVRLDVSGTSERHVRLAAERWAIVLQRIVESESRSSEEPSSCHGEAGMRPSVAILGPAPGPRLRGRYYWRLLVRSPSQEDVLRVVRETFPDMERLPRSGGIRCSVDVDPVTML